MKLGFSPSIGPFDFEAVVDVTVEWELGTARLVIDRVCALGSEKLNLMVCDDPLLKAIGLHIADLAEDDSRLLARAVAQDNDEREAA